MTDLVILVPVLNRPHRVAPFLEAVERTTPGARVLFLVDRDDTAEYEAIRPHMREGTHDLRLGSMEVFEGNPTYAEKINQGVRVTIEPWILFAADDLEPQAGWLEAAITAIAFDGPAVVGLNDLIPRRRNRREHATHFLVSRSYAALPTIDGGEGPLHTGYHHWCVDDELIGTATARGAYIYAPEARIKHLHPMTGEAKDDSTYRRGRRRAKQDRQILRSREALWA